MLQGVLVDEAIEVLCQRAGDCGRSPGAGAIDQPAWALGGKALDPLAQRRRGKGQRGRDGLEAGPLDDGAHRLGPPEPPGLCRLFQEGLQGGESVLRAV
jgi:hypothetical protein